MPTSGNMSNNSPQNFTFSERDSLSATKHFHLLYYVLLHQQYINVVVVVYFPNCNRHTADKYIFHLSITAVTYDLNKINKR